MDTKEAFIDFLLGNIMDILESIGCSKKVLLYSIEACLRFASRTHMLMEGSLEDLKESLLEQWNWNLEHPDVEEKVLN